MAATSTGVISSDLRGGKPAQVQDGPVRREAIDHVVRQIVERFSPRRIILFGSYANGRPHAGSDVDLLVEMETPLREAQQAVQICQQIEYHFGIDLLVRTPTTIQRRLAQGDGFLADVLEHGTVLYDATRR
jgi:predicted nucleotidyltransferase